MLIPCNERSHCEIIYKHVQQFDTSKQISGPLQIQRRFLKKYEDSQRLPRAVRGIPKIVDGIIP